MGELPHFWENILDERLGGFKPGAVQCWATGKGKSSFVRSLEIELVASDEFVQFIEAPALTGKSLRVMELGAKLAAVRESGK